MTVSDLIEQLLVEMLSSSDGTLEIQRNILAGQLNCVPSQINYVIKTRFTPEKGYQIESRRGGGGSVRIQRIERTDSKVSSLIDSVGSSLDYRTAADYVSSLLSSNEISEREAALMMAALSDKSILASNKNEARAVILKNMLLTVM